MSLTMPVAESAARREELATSAAWTVAAGRAGRSGGRPSGVIMPVDVEVGFSGRRRPARRRAGRRCRRRARGHRRGCGRCRSSTCRPARSRPISANRRSVSRAVSEVVGSSKMMILASSWSALATSTSWRSPGERRSSGVSGGEVEIDLARAARASARAMACRSMSASGPKRRRGKPVEEDVLGDGQVGEEIELLVDEGDAVAAGVGRDRAGRRARRRDASCRRRAGRRRR